MTEAQRQVPLDERLVDVTLGLLADEGIERLSLRRIARRAGVSHGAPLRHYRGLSHLLAEVAARGFRLLSAAIERSSARVPGGGGSRARLVAAGRAYVEAAVANPGLFALMFRPDALDVSDPCFERESACAFDHVVRRVRAAQDEGWHPSRDTRMLAGCVWASVHGLATLWAQGSLLGPVPNASLDEMISTTLELVITSPDGGNQ
jgi:AcrR family transcriptional regulator